MGCKGLPIGFPNLGQWKSKLHKWNHFHHVPPVRGHTGSQISGKLLEVSPMLAAHLRDHPSIKHDKNLLGNCDLYMGYSPKIYAIDLSLSLLSHSWSNHEFLFRFEPFGEGVLQGMLCLAPWDHKPCDEETYHGQISNYKSVIEHIWTFKAHDAASVGLAETTGMVGGAFISFLTTGSWEDDGTSTNTFLPPPCAGRSLMSWLQSMSWRRHTVPWHKVQGWEENGF